MPPHCTGAKKTHLSPIGFPPPQANTSSLPHASNPSASNRSTTTILRRTPGYRRRRASPESPRRHGRSVHRHHLLIHHTKTKHCPRGAMITPAWGHRVACSPASIPCATRVNLALAWSQQSWHRPATLWQLLNGLNNLYCIGVIIRWASAKSLAEAIYRCC